MIMDSRLLLYEAALRVSVFFHVRLRPRVPVGVPCRCIGMHCSDRPRRLHGAGRCGRSTLTQGHHGTVNVCGVLNGVLYETPRTGATVSTAHCTRAQLHRVGTRTVRTGGRLVDTCRKVPGPSNLPGGTLTIQALRAVSEKWFHDLSSQNKFPWKWENKMLYLRVSYFFKIWKAKLSELSNLPQPQPLFNGIAVGLRGTSPHM